MTLTILTAVVFASAVILFGMRAGREAGETKLNIPFVLAGVLGSAFIMRLFLGYSTMGYEADIELFKTWGQLINSVGYNGIYVSGVFCDYPPGYLYVLGFMDRVRELLNIDPAGAGFTLMIKLPSMAGDIVCAGMIYLIGRDKVGKLMALAASAAYAFCPAVIINSTVWGQADSFCLMILLISLYMLFREKIIPAAVLYGLAVICKPQMLIFAPVYIFGTLFRKNIKGFFVGIGAALATILIVAAPFTDKFNYMWLIDKYQSTIDYYSYYTVNAYNIWGILGRNWMELPEEGFSLHLLNISIPVLATLFCGIVIYMGRKKRGTIFPAAAIVMSTVYIFAIKMHERYLFPALVFILISWMFTKNRRYIYIFGLLSSLHFINVAYVLYLNNAYVDPNAPQIILLSAAHILMYIWFAAEVVRDFCFGKEHILKEASERKPLRFAHGEIICRDWFSEDPVPGRLTKKDAVLIAALTVIYGITAFANLGEAHTAVKAWSPENGERAVIKTSQDADTLMFLPGIDVHEDKRTPKADTAFRLETSQDGKEWSEAAYIDETSVYAWTEIPLGVSARYFRITAEGRETVINEVGFKVSGEDEFADLTIVEGDCKALTDEQDQVPLRSNYMNSTYFDEIYHARTAEEFILGSDSYENTHPPLGKQIIALGILIFGMNPFGWRFMGTLLGVLMLPIFYHILKRLFNSSFLSVCGTLLFAFDFMHFTQTRIATIDTYAVFFLLLMFDAMLIFIQMEVGKAPMKKILPVLLVCGIFTGMGIAAKWTAAYGAVGLAVLFFVKLISDGVKISRNDSSEETKKYLKKSLKICLWCVLFFIVVPFGIYFASFLPLTTLPGNSQNIWQSFWGYQTHMFNYHSQLVAEHSFASPWYEWPLDIRNIWYHYSTDPFGTGGVSTINCLGNPMLWWVSLAALLAAAVMLFVKKKTAALFCLVGFASVYVPWTLVPRLTFVYHYFTAVPFIVMALIYAAYELKSNSFFAKPLMEKGVLAAVPVYKAVLAFFVLLNLVLFAMFYPVISGRPTTSEYIEFLQWMPQWYFGA